MPDNGPKAERRCHACGGAGVIPANPVTAAGAEVQTCPACNGTGTLTRSAAEQERYSAPRHGAWSGEGEVSPW